jgi:hypothetical protein
MTYNLSKKSRGRLVGVHPDFIKVVERTIEITEIDKDGPHWQLPWKEYP